VILTDEKLCGLDSENDMIVADTPSRMMHEEEMKGM
jgi:hypothetical protein